MRVTELWQLTGPLLGGPVNPNDPKADSASPAILSTATQPSSSIELIRTSRRSRERAWSSRAWYLSSDSDREGLVSGGFCLFPSLVGLHLLQAGLQFGHDIDNTRRLLRFGTRADRLSRHFLLDQAK